MRMANCIVNKLNPYSLGCHSFINKLQQHISIKLKCGPTPERMVRSQ